MFKQGSFVTLRGGAGTPFKIEIAVHFSAFGDVMPVEQQCEAWNVYAFRDEHGHMVCALESELQQWIPQNEVEAWICQDITRLWPRYLHWQHIAEILGVPVEALIGRERAGVPDDRVVLSNTTQRGEMLWGSSNSSQRTECK